MGLWARGLGGQAERGASVDLNCHVLVVTWNIHFVILLQALPLNHWTVANKCLGPPWPQLRLQCGEAVRLVLHRRELCILS